MVAAAVLSSDTLAGYLLLLDFERGRYRHGSTFARGLNALPGYTFSDSVDNLPNIDSNGYSALTAESSKLSFTSPITADTDFILWAVADLTSTAATQVLAQIDDGTSNNRYLIYANSTGTPVAGSTSGGVAATRTGSGTANGRRVTLLRRSGGNLSVCVKAVDGAITIGAASAATAPAGTMTKLRIGVNTVGSYFDGTIRRVGMRLGAFTDAEITSLLSAA